MKIFNALYNLKSEYNGEYLLLADFHGAFNLSLAHYIKENDNSKYIIIAGDLLNGNEWSNNIKINQLKEFLKIISSNKKIIVSLGNHDLWHLDSNGIKNFYSLSKIDNVFPIYNESLILDNNRFTSFVPSQKLYSYKKQDDKETIDSLINEYHKHFSNFSYSKSIIEHLVSHNPMHFSHNEVRKEISSNHDIIYTGHFHDGWIPTKHLQNKYDEYLDKGIPEVIKKKLSNSKDNSLIKEPRRNLSRGSIYIYEDGYILILPNNEIYYYNKQENHYSLKDSNYLEGRLNNEKVPPVIISGAVNTFMNLKLFYPYITNVSLTNEYSLSNKIKVIKKH